MITETQLAGLSDEQLAATDLELRLADRLLAAKGLVDTESNYCCGACCSTKIEGPDEARQDIARLKNALIQAKAALDGLDAFIESL